MPGGLPLGLALANGANISANVATSDGTVITSGAANTKGSYSQLIASTAADTCWMVVYGDGLNASSTTMNFVDIAVGGSGSEVNVANNLGFNSQLASFHSFPISIPSGSRVSARIQNTTASSTLPLNIIIFDGEFIQMEGAAGVDAIGALLGGPTTGTTVTAGAINTLGSFAQLTASTSVDYMGLFFAMDHNGTVIGATDELFLVDIAVGGAGSEKVIIPQLQTTIVHAQSSVGPAHHAFVPMQIPSGTRISARSQCSVASATFNLVAYGVYQ